MRNKILSFCLALTGALFTLPGAPAFAGGWTPYSGAPDLQQQLLSQGPLLLGNLRHARAAALRLDPWGLAYSLRQALRVLDVMSAAEYMIRSERSPPAGGSAALPPPPLGPLPLGQVLALDRPGPGGHAQTVARYDQRVGAFRPETVRRDIRHALAALSRRPAALGEALLATQAALDQVRWDKVLEPADWSAARDQVLKVYALALDSRPEALSALDRAHRALAALPGGKPYARELAALRVAPAQNLPALGMLVRKLDAKVLSLRKGNEVAH